MSRGLPTSYILDIPRTEKKPRPEVKYRIKTSKLEVNGKQALQPLKRSEIDFASEQRQMIKKTSGMNFYCEPLSITSAHFNKVVASNPTTPSINKRRLNSADKYSIKLYTTE